jgi:hypothetical protein
LEDVELIYTNSLAYNGAESPLTQTARKLMEVCRENIAEVSKIKDSLEKNVTHTQNK